MKVYQIEYDPKCQSLEPRDMTDDTPELIELMTFDGMPKAEKWSPVHMEIPMPKLLHADVYHLSDALIATPRAFEVLEKFFRMAGELLPIVDENGVTMNLLNVTQCVNTLDHEKTRFRQYINGKGRGPVEYAFRDRFVESTLFKIPETACGPIYCLEREGDPDEEFKAAFEAHSFKGIRFKEVWRQD